MKKIFLIAASAMMVLASCTKVVINYPEDAQPQEIAMFAVNKGMTKAPVSTFPDDYKMMVSAYLVSGVENVTDAGEYFNQKLFAKSQKGTWTGGQYWPISAAKINFFAVAPEVAAATQGGIVPVATQIADYDDTKNEKVATTIVKSNSVNQYDVMYALGQGSYVGQGSYTPVSMKFNHALSWINFQVKNGTTGTSVPKIVVNSITLNKVYFDGTAEITASDYAEPESPTIDATAVTWTADGTPETTVALPEESANYTLTLNSDYVQFANDGLLVIPHDYTNDNSKPSFTINYTVTQDNKSFTYDYTYTFTNGVKWDVGKKYVYKVSITLKEIEVKPEVGTWGDDNETTVDAK